MMATKTVKLAVLTSGVDAAITSMATLGDSKEKLNGDSVVKVSLLGADLTEEKLALISAEITKITDKGAVVKVSMAGGTGDIEKATADTNALSAAGARVSTTLEDEGKKAETAGSKIKGGMGNLLGSLGLTPLIAGFAGVGLAAGESVKQAASYQKELALLVTDAGESQKNLAMVGNGIEGIAISTGTTLSQLTSGMFMIESAGYHGAAGLAVLNAAAEGAKTSGADLGTTANALTTVMTDYGFKATQATAAMSGLNAIVANGKTHLEDLAASMSKVLPTASTLHVSFGEVGGAMATMTGEGISAKLAAMGLNSTMISLAAPNKVAAKTMLEVGTSSTEVGNQLTKVGLVSTLQMITQLVGDKFPVGSAKYIAALNAIMGGHKGLQVALALTGDHLTTFEKNTKTVTAAVKDGSKEVTGWATTQKTLSNEFDKFKEMLQVAAVRIGTLLIPVLTKVLEVITGLVSWFAALSGPVKVAVTALIGFGIGVMIFGAVTTAVKEFGLALKAAVTDNWVGILVTVIIVAVMLIITHWQMITKYFDEFRHDAAAIFDGVAADISNIWNSIWNNTIARVERGLHDAALDFDNLRHGTAAKVDGIKADLENIWNSIWNNTIGRLTRGIGDAVNLFNSLRSKVNAVGAAIRADIEKVWDTIWANTVSKTENGITTVINWFKGLPGRIVAALGNVGSLLFGAGQRIIQSLINGVMNMVGAVGNAVSSVVNTIKNFLPFSPAKKGPLSGAGAPSNSGVAISKQLGQGILTGLPSVQSAMARVAGSITTPLAASSLAASSVGSGAAGSGQGVTVNVYAHPSNNPDEVARQVWQQLRVLRTHMGNQPLGLG